MRLWRVADAVQLRGPSQGCETSHGLRSEQAILSHENMFGNTADTANLSTSSLSLEISPDTFNGSFH